MPVELRKLEGATFIEDLPAGGQWMLRCFTIDGVEIVAAVNPMHPPRFYRDGKRVPVDWPRQWLARIER